MKFHGLRFLSAKKMILNIAGLICFWEMDCMLPTQPHAGHGSCMLNLTAARSQGCSLQGPPQEIPDDGFISANKWGHQQTRLLGFTFDHGGGFQENR